MIFRVPALKHEPGSLSIELLYIQVLVPLFVTEPDRSDADKHIDQFHIASRYCVVQWSCSLGLFSPAFFGSSIHNRVRIMFSRVFSYKNLSELQMVRATMPQLRCAPPIWIES